MADSPQELIARQVRRVRRRLWARSLLQGTIMAWAAAFLAAAGYFVVRTLIWGTGPEWEGPAVLGGSFGLGMLAGLIWMLVRAPGSVLAALELDQKFGLKERVTTFCSLPRDQAQSPAGQALTEDVYRKVAGLDIAAQFPLRLRWSQAMIPLCASLLAVASLFFSPELKLFGNSRHSDPSRFVTDPAKMQVELDNLKKAHFKKESEQPPSKEMKEIEEEWDKLLKKELDPKNEEQVRETIQAMRNLEEKMQERIRDMKDLKEKSKDLKKTLEQLDKLGKKMKDGPAQDFQDALAKGNLKKAREELDKLKKKIENNELGKADQEKLAQQLKDLQEKLQRLHDQQELRDQLQKDFEDGKIDQEQLQRELDKLNQEQGELADLQDLADLLEECKSCLGRGDGQGLAGKLERIRARLQALDIDEDELERLREEQKRLEAIRKAMLAACQGRCEGQCEGNGLGQGKFPGTKRPVGEEPNSKVKDQRQAGDTDPKGQMRITGFTKGGVFGKIPAKEVGGAFQQAAQEAPEVLDRQRIPADAADIAKGYFRELGGQK